MYKYGLKTKIQSPSNLPHHFLLLNLSFKLLPNLQTKGVIAGLFSSAAAAAMAFVSFLGRLLFVSIFILSAYQEFNEFGVDGGPAAKYFRPKFNVFSKHITTQTGLQLPHVEMKHLVLGTIIMKALGSFLFVFGSSFGAIILLLHQAFTAPILYDFYNVDADKKEFDQLFIKFTKSLALIGALLFFIGMKNSMPRRSAKKKASKTKTN